VYAPAAHSEFQEPFSTGSCQIVFDEEIKLAAFGTHMPDEIANQEIAVNGDATAKQIRINLFC